MALVLDGTNGVSGVDGTASNPAIEGTDSNTGIFYPAADTVAIGTGGTEALRVNSSQQVGIGTTSILGNSVLNVAQGVVARNSGATLPYFQTYNSNAGTDLKTWRFGGNSSGALTFETVNDAYSSATGRMTLDANGNLVLGTTSSLSSSAGRTDLTINAASTSALISFGVGAIRRGYIYQDTSELTIANEVAGTMRFLNNGTERARITSGGLLLIGATAGSASRLEINGTENVCTIINSSATDANYKTSIAFTDVNGNTRGTIRVNTSATQYNTSSDYRLKENVQPMTGALDKVALLKPCTFNWKIDGHDGQGFIAHELAEIFPDAVAGEKDAIETYTDSDGNEQTRPAYQGIDTSFLVATLTAAIQELNAKVEAQAAEIAALKGNA